MKKLIQLVAIYTLPSTFLITAQNNYPINQPNLRLAQDKFVTQRPALSINGFDDSTNTGRGLKRIPETVADIKLINPTPQVFLTPDVPLQGAVVVME